MNGNFASPHETLAGLTVSTLSVFVRGTEDDEVLVLINDRERSVYLGNFSSSAGYSIKSLISDGFASFLNNRIGH